ncbi:MAG: hypothetical protein U0931_01240 [Vulcanimicrobiota bacterium]
MKKWLIAACLTAVAWSVPLDNGVQGAWVSPDWFLPGTRKYNEEDVRVRSRRMLKSLADSGFNTVFLETFLRGYSIAPSLKDGRVTSDMPVYPHLRWNYRYDGAKTYDTLQIFIDEAQQQGIEVHAWTHMFYWKMDNPGANLAWHAAPSLWSQMMVSYLRTQADKLAAQPQVAPETVRLMRDAAILLTRTTEAKDLDELIGRYHFPMEGRPLGMLLRTAMRAGAERPTFILMGTEEDPFPAPRGKVLRPIYMNPGSPEVRALLVKSVQNIVENHPGLAGVHLDHIRYPVDGQGLPEEFEVQDGTYNYYSQASQEEMTRYQAVHKELAQRRENLRMLVDDMRAMLGNHRTLSSAVLPVYYRERDNGRFRLGGYDFAAQDWVDWKVDFVVPMLYEMNPYFIRALLSLFQEEELKRLGQNNKIAVYPGVSQTRTARTALPEIAGWVFFDLSLSRDVKLEKKEATEDLNFGAQ